MTATTTIRPTAAGPPTATVPRWVRVGLAALGLPNVATGLWAILSPQGWFDDFPGFDPRLVAAIPPFNEHLATDAGAGLLASGVVLVGAAWLADRRTVTLAIAAFAAFAVPHTLYHAIEPAPGLTGAEDVQNVAVLAFSLVAAIVLLAGSRHSQEAAS